jgi:serine protease inhibitor
MRTSDTMLVGSMIFGFICSFGCSDPLAEVSDNIGELVSANNTFGFNVFEQLVGKNMSENIFVSPASLAMALSMTYNGASGETQEAMARVLELRGMSLEKVSQASAALMERLRNLGEDMRLDMANSLWVREGEEFRADFLKRNEEFYGAKIGTLDFGDPKAPSIIDAWVKEKTGGKIKKIVEEIPGGIILYLIDAVYFKGAWAVKFERQYTRERDFTLLDGSKKKVPMMMTGSKEFKHLKGDSFDAVGLPYGDGSVSMYIFVPHRESSLDEFYGELRAGNWDEWMSRFQKSEITVVMPRFNLEYEVVLSDALADLGMEVAFDSNAADFSRMCAGKVWIDEVKQKTFMEVNEEGTEAAAATSVRMKKGPGIYVDRPFFCAIRDNDTGAMLFMGSVVEP